jgi:DNA topoisomerase-3
VGAGFARKLKTTKVMRKAFQKKWKSIPTSITNGAANGRAQKTRLPLFINAKGQLIIRDKIVKCPDEVCNWRYSSKCM